MIYGDKSVPLYIEPGDRLEVFFNGREFPFSLYYKGKGSDENNFLKQVQFNFKSLTLVDKSGYQPKDDQIAFLRRIFDEVQSMKLFLEHYISETKVAFSSQF